MNTHTADLQLHVRTESPEEGTSNQYLLVHIVPSKAVASQVLRFMRRPYYLIMQHSMTGASRNNVPTRTAQLVPAHTPYGYIRLARPGPSSLTVYIVDISKRANRHTLLRVRRTMHEIKRDFNVSDVVAHHEVTSDSSSYPKPVPYWQRVVIHRYFDNLAKTTCGIRAQLTVSCLVELLVQVCGIAVRALSVLGVLACMRRNIAWSRLIDIRISALWTESGRSLLTRDRKGTDRAWWLIVDSVYLTMSFWAVCVFLWITSIVLTPFIILLELCLVRSYDTWSLLCDRVKPYRYADGAFTCEDRDPKLEEVRWDTLPRRTLALRAQRAKARLCLQYAQ